MTLIAFYFTILVNLSTNVILYKKLKDLGFLNKSIKSKFNLSSFLGLLFILVPGLNVGLSVVTIFITIKSLHNDEVLLRSFGRNVYSSSTIKNIYEKDNVAEETLKDVLTLDGASKKQIDEELVKIEKQKRGFEDVSSFRSFFTPDFSDSEYEWAYSVEKAKSLLEALSLDVTVNEEERFKLLKLFEKYSLNELKGKDKASENTMKKVLKIVRKSERNNQI